MKVRVLTLLMVQAFYVRAQTETNLGQSNEWNTATYTQEAKIYNSLYLTPLQNPALAGFDRQLVASYGFAVSNTAYNVPDQAASEPAFWQQTALIDFAFAGPRKNAGVTLAYQGGQEWRSEFHRINLATSYRFKFKNHHLILGSAMQLEMTNVSMQHIVFADMIDPRQGVVYKTQEVPSDYGLSSLHFSFGVFYYWKRLWISYSFGKKLEGYQSYNYLFSSRFFHDAYLGYHISVGRSFTLSPAFGFYYDDYVWTRHTQYFFPSVMATYQDKLFARLSTPFLDRLQLDVGIQINNQFRITASVAPYFLKKMSELNGLATAGGSIRYLIPVWKP